MCVCVCVCVECVCVWSMCCVSSCARDILSVCLRGTVNRTGQFCECLSFQSG